MRKIMLMMCIALGAMAFTNVHQDHFQVDSKKSSIHWIGEKVTGSHEGNIAILSGVISLEHGTLVAANFTINMNSITCTDIESPEYNQKLVNHLKNEDFFDVANHPIAEFKMINATPTEGGFNVLGALTIKGKTHPATFDVGIQQRGSSLVASGKMSFDRTKYGITYGSGSFIDDLGDRAIYDEVKLEFVIMAENKSHGAHH